MKRQIFLFNLIILFTILFTSLVGCNNQTPTKEQPPVSTPATIPEVKKTTTKEEYDLHEQCSKRCQEVFRKEYGDNGEKGTYANTYWKCTYQNHYNKKLNKCLYLLSCFGEYRDYNYRLFINDNKLIDVNEGKEYGHYLDRNTQPGSAVCESQGKECTSIGEWESLIKPYMEE